MLARELIELLQQHPDAPVYMTDCYEEYSDPSELTHAAFHEGGWKSTKRDFNIDGPVWLLEETA